MPRVEVAEGLHAAQGTEKRLGCMIAGQKRRTMPGSNDFQQDYARGLATSEEATDASSNSIVLMRRTHLEHGFRVEKKRHF